MSNQRVFSIAILTLFLVATAGPATAEPVQELLFGASGVDFVLSGDVSGSVTLRVAGPGLFRQQHEFAAGTTPFLSTFDDSGQPFAAGHYKWSLAVNQEAEGDRPLSGTRQPAVTQSGSFTVLANGSLADPNLSEAGLTKDQVILDDLIVDGSACIGMDCVNGESFGFDTIRMKENNLRLRAVDTSSTSSFPSRDWQLTFNDSSNGGANKFAIDDIDGGRTPFTIEAGAPSHSLYVDDGGRVGFGTSTPVADLHVKSGNTPTLRLEQDGTSGFTAQTWDVAGNEANFFIRDATNGSTLPFRIFPGAPSNALNIEASTGDIGLGDTSPDAALDVERNNSNNLARFENTQSGGSARVAIVNGNGTEWRMTSSATTDSLKFSEIGVHSDAEWELFANGVVRPRGLTTAPTCDASNAGGIYYDNSGALCFCDGSSWSVAAGGGTCV